jgi:hypothetical protein
MYREQAQLSWATQGGEKVGQGWAGVLDELRCEFVYR